MIMIEYVEGFWSIAYGDEHIVTTDSRYKRDMALANLYRRQRNDQ